MMLKKALEEVVAAAERDRSEGDYDGPDWWQLLPEEQEVFEIDPERWLQMMTAWQFYEILLGITDEDVPGLNAEELEAARVAAAAIVDQGRCLRGFSAFAVEYAALTMREAHAAYAKMDFWSVRQGITSYLDEG